MRKWKYAYKMLRRPIQTAYALRFGTLIHHALEAWWRSGGDLAAALNAITLHESDPFERAKARAMIRGYHVRWSAEELTVIAVEVMFECDLVNPATGRNSRNYRRTGKIDAICQKPDGTYWLVEHKSSGEDIGVGSSYWKKLKIDGQISMYVEGAKLTFGYEIAGCLYDVLRKPAQKPYQVGKARPQAETPDEYEERILTGAGGKKDDSSIMGDPDRYLRRGNVVRMADEMEEANYDVWQAVQNMHAAATSDRYPRNVDACNSFHRDCEYLPVCAGEASIEDDTLYRTARAAHEELVDDSKCE